VPLQRREPRHRVVHRPTGSPRGLVAGPGCWPNGAKTGRPAAGRAAWCTPSPTVRRRSSSRRGCTPATCSRPVSRPRPRAAAAAASSSTLARSTVVRSRCSCARSASPSRCSRSHARRSSIWLSVRSHSWSPSAARCGHRGPPGAGQPEGLSRAQVPGLGGVGQVVGAGRGAGAAAAKDRAGGLGDGLGGLPDTGEVSPGPAGDVDEAVAAGVQAVRGGHDVRDGLGLDLTAAAAGGVGRQVADVPGLQVR